MPFIVIGLFVLAFFFAGIRILNEYERGVVFRLGRFTGIKQAGLQWIIPMVDRMVKVSLREVVMDVPPQDIITRDNVSVKVNAVIYFRVLHPDNAVIKVENFLYGTSQLAQTTLRSVCGRAELDELLAEREKINHELQEQLDRGTDPWGVKVRAVEIKHIDLPQEMQRAMAKQAEAERERRAKVIHAEGEAQAAERLSDASEIMTRSPFTLQLRYLQTISDISGENSSTVVFPLPVDLLRPFLERSDRERSDRERSDRESRD
jgi:regulator of protease activity HflC (stomatin/prohibitin superfamily)